MGWWWMCQELPLIETGRSSPKPRKPPVAAATTHFPLVSRTSPQHTPEASRSCVRVFGVEICWDFVFRLSSVLRFLPFLFHVQPCSVLISPPPWEEEKNMFSEHRSKACTALRSGRISHHTRPWIQFALGQLHWTREFGLTWQEHGGPMGQKAGRVPSV